MRPRLLDLYSGQGGAAMGYARAGFDVTGVDIVPQPRYPFEFHQADALEYLAEHGHEYDAIHASPPCQDHSTLRSRTGDHGTGHLLGDTLDALETLGLPYVVENVAGADLAGRYRLVLCGSMFHLATVCRDGLQRQLRRHRQFVINFAAMQPQCHHVSQPVGVYGNGGGGQMTRGYMATKAEALDVMGTPWMDRAGVSQAIPPRYTEFIGAQLIEHIAREAA